jgi:FkbM family methyltransferase
MNNISWQGSDFKTKILLSYLRSPDHPMKVRLIQTIIDKLYPKGLIATNQLGAKIYVQPHDYIGWAILSKGSYEGFTLALATKLLKEGGTFLDIGSNFGLFTCSVGMIPKTECYCVEPSAREFLRLQENIALNPGIRAKLFNLALDNSVKLLELEDFNPGNSGTVRILLEDEYSNSGRHTVAATTLQELLSHTKVTNITLMKIDVEGYELPVLEGIDWQGSFRPRNIITEFTDYSSRAKGIGRQSLLEFFTERGYEGFTVDGKPLSLEQNPLEDNAWFRDITYCH